MHHLCYKHYIRRVLDFANFFDDVRYAMSHKNNKSVFRNFEIPFFIFRGISKVLGDVYTPRVE